MTEASFSCWRCGAVLPPAWFAPGARIGRESRCSSCEADLKVCRQCRYHDPALRTGCRHDEAEPVPDRERANFCELFEPSSLAGPGPGPGGGDDRRARAALAALFGEKESTPALGESDEERARRELDRLFGIEPKGSG